MDQVMGFLLFALIIAAIWGFNKMMQSATSKLNQKAQSKKHRAGQNATSTTLLFSSPTVPPQALGEKIYAALTYPESDTPTNALTFGVYKSPINADTWAVCYGKKLIGDHWQYVLSAEDDELVCSVVDATLVDGIVSGVKQLVTMQQEVKEFARQAAPDVTIDFVEEEVQWK